MTTNKNFKERVRARMERTGESYAAARAQVLKENGAGGQGRVVPLPRERRRSAMTAAHGCAVGDYPWDRWFTRAKAAGIPDRLAHLGRSLMREADQHAWCRELWERCGWLEESAEGMVRFALAAPGDAEKHWLRLMETDGCDVDVGADFRPLTDEEFDAEYTTFALAFDAYVPADRIAGEEEDPFVDVPGVPGIRVPRSRVDEVLARLENEGRKGT